MLMQDIGKSHREESILARAARYKYDAFETKINISAQVWGPKIGPRDFMINDAKETTREKWQDLLRWADFSTSGLAAAKQLDTSNKAFQQLETAAAEPTIGQMLHCILDRQGLEIFETLAFRRHLPMAWRFLAGNF